MTRRYFDQIVSQGWKSGRCVVCGKQAERSRQFTNTVNPFNRNADGTQRTHAEVRANVERQRREWEAEPVTHARCES